MGAINNAWDNDYSGMQQEKQAGISPGQISHVGISSSSSGGQGPYGHTGGTGGASLLHATNVSSQQQMISKLTTIMGAAAISAEIPSGELYWRGNPLPADWKGSHYDRFERRIAGDRWHIVLFSRWTEDAIVVFLELDAYSGADVNALAKTYLEAINQRRLG